jgi:RHS repeat-associated protein
MQKLNIYLACVLALCSPHIQAQTPRDIPSEYPNNPVINYVRTWDAIKPTADANAIMGYDVQDVRMTTQYLDGLGRPLQTVVKKGSMKTGIAATDLVSSNVYDAFGREAVKYLPYADAGNNGLFKKNPFNPQVGFYNQQLDGQQNEFTTAPTLPNWAYSQTNFEASPLNRPQESFAPGVSWVGSSGQTPEANRHSIKMKYWINTATDAVRVWNVTNATIGSFGTYASTTTYAAGELYKNVTVDERNNQVIEFKDKEGKVILKKVQIGATPDNGTGVSHTKDWLCTYYIYDDLNQLRCVIQPEAVKKMENYPNTPDWSLTSYLDEQCFRYEYDHRGRMIMKKVPGAGHVDMVYDARDRLTIIQDANMRSQNPQQWLYTQYDDLNRPVLTGIFGMNVSAQAHRDFGADKTDHPWAYLAGVTQEILSITHYDDYASLPSGLSPFLTTWNTHFAATDNDTWPYPQLVPTASTATKGMVTWTQIKILGTATFLNAVSYYDEKGRLIQQQSTNITGGTDVVTTQYSWAGQPLVSVQKQAHAGSGKTMVIVSKNWYDDLGRLVRTDKRQSHTDVDGNAMSAYKTIAELKYDKLGQLSEKKLAPAYNSGGGLETLTYDYNIRGWVLGANRGYARDDNNDHYFGFDLGYDKQNNNLINSQQYAAPQYNGNITGMVWKSKGDGEKRKYDFGYDNANRLLKADFNQYTGSSFNQDAGINYDVKMGDGSDPAAAYDANGNIKQMQQWGLKLNSSSQLDNLGYQYIANSNKLLSVTEATLGSTDNKLGDFTDKNISNDDYSYDVNGNLTLDKNKSISSIAYNHLNLPSVINVAGKGSITYTYDASGNKLRKTTVENNVSVAPYNGITVTSTTEYIGGFIYESKQYDNTTVNTDLGYLNKLQFTGHEEGRIRPTYTEGTTASAYALNGFEYDYMIKDHLGNVRMVLTDQVQEDTYPVLSFEGTSGTQEVNDQNAIWENASGNAIDVIGRRTVSPGTLQGSGMVPPPGTQSLLVKSSTGKIGAGKLLKVMSGDKIHTTVQYYYSTNTGSGGTNGLSTLTSALATMLGNSVGALPSIKDGASTVTSALSGNTAAQSFFNGQTSGSNNGRPKAFLNVLFFDEQFKFESTASYSEQIGSSSYGQIVIALGSARQAAKNGYCYVYVSNETDDMLYFDNLTLTHERGAILEETHYYPFGLTMAGISSKAAGGLGNKNKFNGKEEQRQEFSDGSGLEWLDFGARMYDNQLGRWMTVDPMASKFANQTPYAGMDNNPINIIDPTGQSGEPVIDKKTKTITVTSNITFYGAAGDAKLASKTASNIQSQWNAAKGVTTIDGVKYSVKFVVTGTYDNTITAKDISGNTDIKNNYINIVDAGIDVSKMDAAGSNTGTFLKSNLEGSDGTTEAHEMGHGFGLDHPTNSDLRTPASFVGPTDGTPGIMNPRGTAVDGAFTYDPTKGATTVNPATGARANTMNPSTRKVTQNDINNLGLDKLSYDPTTGKSQLGKLTNQAH